MVAREGFRGSHVSHGGTTSTLATDSEDSDLSTTDDQDNPFYTVIEPDTSLVGQWTDKQNGEWGTIFFPCLHCLVKETVWIGSIGNYTVPGTFLHLKTSQSKQIYLSPNIIGRVLRTVQTTDEANKKHIMVESP